MLTQMHNLSELEELPVEGILHVLDNFQMDNPPVLVPRDDNPIIKINEYRKFVLHVTKFGDDESKVPVDTKGIILPTTGLLTSLAQYKRQHMPNIRIMENIVDMPQRTITLPMVSYNSLYRARITGMRRRLRFLNALLATIMNQVLLAPERQHFIHIPLAAMRFEKPQFVRVFKKMDRTTVIFPELPQYIFLAHFYAILASEIQVGDDTFIDDEPSTEGWDVTSSDILKGLRDFTLESIGEEGAALEALQEDQKFRSSIFELVPTMYWNKINFLFTSGDYFVCYNLAQLKGMNGKSNTALLRVMNQINNLADLGAPGVVEEEATKVVSETVVTVTPSETKINAPVYAEPLPKETLKEYAKEDVKELDKAAKKVAEDTPNLTPAQRERAKTISTVYKTVKIGDDEIGKLLEKEPSTSIKENDLPFIKQEVPMPDETSSSIDNLDKTYMETTFKRDLADILTCFGKQGMYLQEVEEKVVDDKLNSLRSYTAHYEDVNHKNHTIKFTVPNVDGHGRCRVNGTIKMMTKQRVNNPICKVSPVRVTLNTNFNKAIVFKNENVAHTLTEWMAKFIRDVNESNPDYIKVLMGDNKYPIQPLPGDYTLLGSKYNNITIGDNHKLFFDFEYRFTHVPEAVRKDVEGLEKEYGVLVGYGEKTNQAHFMQVDGSFTTINLTDKSEAYVGNFVDAMGEIVGTTPPPFTEWTEFTLLGKNLPTIFSLSYRYGLLEMLKYCNVDYRLEDVGTKLDVSPSDTVIRFADKRLIIPRIPVSNSILFGGLAYFDFRDILFEEMEEKDVYYDLLQQKKLSINYIKGIDDFFDLAIDGLTRNALREMNQPTDVRDLLLSANRMLTTREHLDASSRTNFRFRGVEQITGIVYNEMARAFATYRNKSIGAKNTWSMSEYLIKQRIMQEQLMDNISVLNPIDDIKQYTKFSHAGSGGRSNETFKVNDRRYSADSIGVVSEATVDNAKVGMNAITPVDPIIDNVRGMTGEIDVAKLKPSNMLSINSMVMPCVTQDSGQRSNFSSIQASATVPTDVSEPGRVQTGYEPIVAHRTSLPFSYPAEDDGKIVDVNHDTGMVKIQYKNGTLKSLSFGEEYTSNAANGFYVNQPVVLNDFKVGDKFLKGDVLLYNKAFFTPDPYSKQVFWNSGVHTEVALLDNGNTIEDASMMDRWLSEKLRFFPVAIKEIALTTDTTIHKIATVGQEVVSTDALMIFDASAMPAEFLKSEDPELIAMLENLERKTPKAEHAGTVVKIEVFYKCKLTEMTKSLQTVVKAVSKMENMKAAYAQDTDNAGEYKPVEPLTGSDRVGAIDLTEDTIVFRFYIKQSKPIRVGDKIFFDSSLKSVCSRVIEEPIKTESGKEVHGATSARGILARIITSPFFVGIPSGILDTAEKHVLDMWFDEK